MKRILPLLTIVISMFMLFSCGAKEVVNDTPEPVVETTSIVEKAPVVEEVIAVKETVVEEAVVEEIIPEEVIEPVEESIWVKYMIQPNDYLTKIALQEYGVVTMWRTIWDWNLDVIGDNPDLIYPFEELSLQKEAYEAQEVSYEYVDYTVEEGETLWCIAEKLYGNSYAWIIIVRDNLDILGDDYNAITAGTVFKIRTQL